MKETLAASLERARARTLELIEPLSDDALNRVHDPLMSPIAWDLGHIANFEELWLVRHTSSDSTAAEEGLSDVYNPFKVARRDRGELPYLRGEECLAYMRAVRERSLDRLEQVDLSDGAEPLLAGGFVYELIARHEQQHSETILQTLQTMTSEAYLPHAVDAASGTETEVDMKLVEAGPFVLGTPNGEFAYDNERPAFEVDLPAFWIDTYPVTAGAFLRFIEDGGYSRREWWSEEGWNWKESEAVTMPRYWQQDGDGFLVRSFGKTVPVDESRPVCHVSWYEAEAFARHSGKRLPSEAEWEKAAGWEPVAGSKRRYPWGNQPCSATRANLDQLSFSTAPVGSYPDGAAACGAEQLLGDVWEWTASGFEAYPGFEAFPYPEYSEAFFGGPFRVLKGGAWATQPDVATTSFRNWDYPDRRQIFAGFRCARDAGPEEAR